MRQPECCTTVRWPHLAAATDAKSVVHPLPVAAPLASLVMRKNKKQLNKSYK
jgi:hypothetical protein